MGSLTSGDKPSLHKFIKYNRHMGIKPPIVKRLQSDYLMTPIIEKTTSHEALDGIKVKGKSHPPAKLMHSFSEQNLASPDLHKSKTDLSSKNATFLYPPYLNGPLPRIPCMFFSIFIFFSQKVIYYYAFLSSNKNSQCLFNRRKLFTFFPFLCSDQRNGKKEIIYLLKKITVSFFSFFTFLFNLFLKNISSDFPEIFHWQSAPPT